MPFCVVAKLCVAAVLHNAHLQGLQVSSKVACSGCRAPALSFVLVLKVSKEAGR